MKHTLQIRVSKEPVNGGAVSVRSVSHPCEVSRFMMQFSIWVVIGFINVPLQMCLQSC